jgi:hypothetical protein
VQLRHDEQRTQTNTRQSVFLDKSLPLEVRYLAIIKLKNGIDKYWRKTATKYFIPPPYMPTRPDNDNSGVDKEDKAVIRARLLESGVNEADQRLALQNALVIAKIARLEFPNDWYAPAPPWACTT